MSNKLKEENENLKAQLDNASRQVKNLQSKLALAEKAYENAFGRIEKLTTQLRDAHTEIAEVRAYEEAWITEHDENVRLHAQVEDLRSKLVLAQEIIHDEFCSSYTHHRQCALVTDAQPLVKLNNKLFEDKRITPDDAQFLRDAQPRPDTQVLDILRSIAKYGPPQGEKHAGTACAFCDMGGAGYATRGDGFHDDECAVKDAQVYLARTEKVSRIHEDLPPFIEALKTTPLKNSDNT